jgi:hypothetical protein
MWSTSQGKRVLTEAEWALFRVGVERLVDFIADEEQPLGLSGTDIDVFDELQPEQRLALLADVAQALRDPAVPPPPLTAANEATVAAVFASIRQALEMETAPPDYGTRPSHVVRSLLLAVAAELADEWAELLEDLPTVTEQNIDKWDWLLEEIEYRILWDRDFEMGDTFLDQPPEASRGLGQLTGIDRDYFTAVPREPDEAGMAMVRQTLARLLGRPDPDDKRPR